MLLLSSPYALLSLAVDAAPLSLLRRPRLLLRALPHQQLLTPPQSE